MATARYYHCKPFHFHNCSIWIESSRLNMALVPLPIFSFNERVTNFSVFLVTGIWINL